MTPIGDDYLRLDSDLLQLLLCTKKLEYHIYESKNQHQAHTYFFAWEFNGERTRKICDCIRCTLACKRGLTKN